MTRVCLLLGLMLALCLPGLAQPPVNSLAPFEQAVDEQRYVAAGKLLQAMPEGPEKQLCTAELGMAADRSDRVANALAGLPPTSLPPRLRARYLLVLAYQERTSQQASSGDSRQTERLLRDGLRADPPLRDHIRLLLAQLLLYRDEPVRSEEIVTELFRLDPRAGFDGRLRQLNQQGRHSEYLALAQLLDGQAQAQKLPQVAMNYRLLASMALQRADRFDEAVRSLQGIVDESLRTGETALVPMAMTFTNWFRKRHTGQGLTQAEVDKVLEQLPPGDQALDLLDLASRIFPDQPRYSQRAVQMAQELEDPLLAASLLVEQARRESNPQSATEKRRQARELLRGQRQQGAEPSGFGSEVATNLFVAGLSDESDDEVQRRYRWVLERHFLSNGGPLDGSAGKRVPPRGALALDRNGLRQHAGKDRRLDSAAPHGRGGRQSGVLPALDQGESDTRRIYLADLHRKLALASGRSAKAMEAEIALTVDRMLEASADPTTLRPLLLATPAYAELTFLQPSPPLPPSNPTVHGEVNSLEKVLEKLEALRRREPDNEALGQLGAVRIKAMVEAVGPDEVMIRPVLLRHSVLLLVASGGRLAITERFVNMPELLASVGRLTALAADRGALEDGLSRDSEYVSTRLLQPALAEFPGRRHLLWLAQGPLKELPLALLEVQGESLLQRMSVSYLDGPGSSPKFPLSASLPTLLIGGSDDLAGAAQELAEVRALLPKGASWRLGQEFSGLQSLVGQHKLVHISSHGLPPSATSTGELTGSEGSLSAFRLADLSFAPGTLVVAAACQVGSESGQGPGDSTVLNALRTAGAATVLASSWTLDDQSSKELVLAFYRHLLESERPDEALASAQLEMRRTHPHPYHWAGPRIVTGRAR